MQIEKIHHNVEFTAPEIKNFAKGYPIAHDFKSEAIRRSSQLRAFLGNDSILEIRKVTNLNYLVITNGGHQIPVEIRPVPYGRGERFLSLGWDGGVFAMYIDMG